MLYTGIPAPPVERPFRAQNEGDLPGAAPSAPATRHIHPMLKSILLRESGVSCCEAFVQEDGKEAQEEALGQVICPDLYLN